MNNPTLCCHVFSTHIPRYAARLMDSVSIKPHWKFALVQEIVLSPVKPSELYETLKQFHNFDEVEIRQLAVEVSDTFAEIMELQDYHDYIKQRGYVNLAKVKK